MTTQPPANRSLKLAFLSTALFVAAFGMSAPASAQSTAPNSKIVFSSNDFDIYVMDEDGTNVVNLTNSPESSEYSPVWSPDGSKIAFVQGQYYGDGWTFLDIWVMDADGSNRVNLTRTSRNDEFSPSWAPGGQRIAYVKSDDHPEITEDWGIYVMDADGGNVTSLTNSRETPAYEETGPAWAPDGSKIAYAGVGDGRRRIMTMDPDGSNQQVLSSSPDYDHDQIPAWSPDSTKIAFMREIMSEGYQWDIFVMNRDGSGQTNLTQHPQGDQFPTFSPDGTQIAFNSNRDGWQGGIYLVDVPELTPAPATNMLAMRLAVEASGAPTVTRLGNTGANGKADWHRERARAFVTVKDSGFRKDSVVVEQGGTVRWTFEEPGSHTVTDSTGMELFDSGTTAPDAPRFFMEFVAAGIYPYHCAHHPNTTGVVKVPLQASPNSGALNRKFTLTWSSTRAPEGFVYDIQVKRPGAATFVDWRMSRTVRKGSFTPDAGPGEYFFRARMRKLNGGAHARYSPSRRITVAQSQ